MCAVFRLWWYMVEGTQGGTVSDLHSWYKYKPKVRSLLVSLW